MAQLQKIHDTAPGRAGPKDGETLRILRAALKKLEDATKVPEGISSSPMTSGILFAAERGADHGFQEAGVGSEKRPSQCFPRPSLTPERITIAISEDTESKHTLGLINKAVVAACDAVNDGCAADDIISSLLDGAEWTAGMGRRKAFGLVLDAVVDILVMRDRPALSLIGLLEDSVSLRLWCDSAEAILMKADMAGDKERMLLDLLVAKGDMEQILGIQESAESPEVRGIVSNLIDAWERDAALWKSLAEPLCYPAVQADNPNPEASSGPTESPEGPLHAIQSLTSADDAVDPNDPDGILSMLKDIFRGSLSIVPGNGKEPET